MFKAILLLPILLAILAGLAFLGYLVFRTWRTQSDDLQKTWLTGKLPSVPLDGFYKGTTDFHSTWIGKKFMAATQNGINILKSGETETEKFPFKTVAGKGLWETSLDVLKIDYSGQDNPFYVSAITDELVELEPGKYLGKIIVQPLPGLSFILGFFHLEK